MSFRMIIRNFEIAWRNIKVYHLFIKLFYSSEFLQRARLFVTWICGGPYGVTIQKKPLWDRHWSSLVVIESSELLQWARLFVTWICGGLYGVTIQNKPLWDRHWSSLIVIESSELLQRARLFVSLESVEDRMVQPLKINLFGWSFV